MNTLLAPSRKKRRKTHQLNFTQSWEDPFIDAAALRVREDEDSLLSITAGADNTLNLLLEKPKRLVALDRSWPQNALLELKLAGIKTLSHDEYLELLNVKPSTASRRHRVANLYGRLRRELSDRAREFWDKGLSYLQKGILNAGRFERYLAVFRRIVRRLHGKGKIAGLFKVESLSRQLPYYTLEWDTPFWRLLCRLYFSRTALRLGGMKRRDLKRVEGIDSFGENFRKRFEAALMETPVGENYFLAQIFLGRYLTPKAVPPYLEKENFETLRNLVDRIQIVTSDLAAWLDENPSERFDGWNLTNIFEWMEPGRADELFGAIVEASNPETRIVYRNLLVTKRHPEELNDHFESEDELADELLRGDLSFFYKNLEIATIHS